LANTLRVLALSLLVITGSINLTPKIETPKGVFLYVDCFCGDLLAKGFVMVNK